MILSRCLPVSNTRVRYLNDIGWNSILLDTVHLQIDGESSLRFYIYINVRQYAR